MTEHGDRSSPCAARDGARSTIHRRAWPAPARAIVLNQ